MKNITKNILTVLLVLFLMAPAFAQDNRRLETIVADVLAQFPAQNAEHTNKLMVEILETGAPGITQFCDRIVPPGTGNDTQARMALESLAQYAGAATHDKDRKLVESALLAAIEKASDKEVKAFFIRRLYYCGGTESISALEKYLNSADLYTPTLATLTSIRKPEVGVLILKNLPDKKDQQLAAMVKTLGQISYEGAEPYLIELAKTAKGDVLKQVYSSLSNIGGKASFATFEAAPKGVKFQFDEFETMISYIQYAKRLALLGETQLSKQLCDAVLKNCVQPNQLIYRSSVLTVPGFATNDLFLKEVKNTNKAYRVSVLNNAATQLSSQNVGSWIAILKNVPVETQAEIIHFLARRPEPEVLQKVILPKLSSADVGVKTEVIRSLAINQKAKAVPVLLEQLKKAKNDSERSEIEKALYITCSQIECKLLYSQLDKMNNAGKVVLINVLGAHRSMPSYPYMIKYSKSENSAVRLAASTALARVSVSENVPEIISLLKENVISEIAENLQKALIAIYSGPKKPDANLILNEINNEKQERTIRNTSTGEERVATKAPINGGITEKLIPVLAAIDDPKALKTVVELLKTGNPAEREAAFTALSNWKYATAAPQLYAVFVNPEMSSFRMNALKAYLRITLASDLPDDQKLLMIEKPMPACTTIEEKTKIIQAAGNIKTFLSLVFVANYLDDKDLESEAASTAKYLALPSSGQKNGLTGEYVTGVLSKVMGKMSGPDFQYDVIDVREYIAKMPKEAGYVSIFNGKDLSGWQGLVKNPVERAKMTNEELAAAQVLANAKMAKNWSVKDGCINFNGEGDNLCTQKMYADFEMLVDWKISKNGDSGIYLRGAPQVQIWDTSRVDVGAQVGSGGLYNNKQNPSKPLVLADNAIGDWNTFRIKMVGERVTVFLNGILVVDNVVMENYWDRSIPIFKRDAIELQAHGTDLAFRNVFVKELNTDRAFLSPQEEKEGFKLLFNGENLENWQGNKVDYAAENGLLVVNPKEGNHGNLYTDKEYSDFVFRFEFQLTPGANNGIGIHAPLEGDAAYVGKEIQVLDNTADIYKDLQPYQYHGSVYGVIPAKREFLKPIGEWNSEEIMVKGDDIKVTLNGTVIVDGNMKDASKKGTADHKDHPGLKRHSGYIGFLGHGSELKFKNIRVKEL